MEIELDVTGLSNDGRGVARPAGERVVFVAGALPGERVLAAVTSEKRGYREAVRTRLVTPSPHAVTPPCPHAGECGGCPLMRMGYPEQLRWKRQLVLDAVARIGRLDGEETVLPVSPIIPSPSLLDHRNKVELAFGMEDGHPILGMRRRLSHEVVATPGCLLVPGDFRDVIAVIGELASRHSCLFPAGGEERPRRGRQRGRRDARQPGPARGLRHCVLRVGRLAGDSTGEKRAWVILVTGRAAARERAAVRALAEDLLRRCPRVRAVVHEERAANDGLARGEKRLAVITRHGDDPGAARMRAAIGGLDYELDCADFFQVNAPAAEHLARLARERLEAGPLLDLYCGVGAPGLSCVRQGDILGIEYSPSSVESARANAARLGIPAEYRAGDAARLVGEATASRRFAQVLCDPPRGGLAPEARAALLGMAPGRIVYISCNPATLARDIAALSPQYAVEEVVPVDLFPHTPHVESVTLLTRR